MRQGGENDQPVNNDITKRVAFWQQCDLTGCKKDEVKLEEVVLCVNVFWFRIILKEEGHPTHPGYREIGRLRTVVLGSNQGLAN